MLLWLTSILRLPSRSSFLSFPSFIFCLSNSLLVLVSFPQLSLFHLGPSWSHSGLRLVSHHSVITLGLWVLFWVLVNKERDNKQEIDVNIRFFFFLVPGELACLITFQSAQDFYHRSVSVHHSGVSQTKHFSSAQIFFNFLYSVQFLKISDVGHGTPQKMW